MSKVFSTNFFFHISSFHLFHHYSINTSISYLYRTSGELRLENALTIVIPPYRLTIDNVEVIVLEVLSTTLVSGEKYYHVVCQLKYKNMLSKRFTIDCRNETEFINKVKLEISRLKLIEAIYGAGFLREVIK